MFRMEEEREGEEGETGDINYLKLRHLLESPEPSINILGP